MKAFVYKLANWHQRVILQMIKFISVYFRSCYMPTWSHDDCCAMHRPSAYFVFFSDAPFCNKRWRFTAFIHRPPFSVKCNFVNASHPIHLQHWHLVRLVGPSDQHVLKRFRHNCVPKGFVNSSFEGFIFQIINGGLWRNFRALCFSRLFS